MTAQSGLCPRHIQDTSKSSNAADLLRLDYGRGDALLGGQAGGGVGRPRPRAAGGRRPVALAAARRRFLQVAVRR